MLKYSIIDRPKSEIKLKSTSINLVSRVINRNDSIIKSDPNSKSIKFNALRTVNEVHYIGLSSEIKSYLEIDQVNEIPKKLTFKLLNKETDSINNRKTIFLKSQVKKYLVNNLSYKSESIFLDSSIIQGITSDSGSNLGSKIGNLNITLEVKRFEYTEFKLPRGYLEGLLPSKYAYAVGDVLKVRSTRLGETTLYTNKGTIILVTIPGIKVDNTEFNLPEIPNELPITQLEVTINSNNVQVNNSLVYNLVTDAKNYEYSIDKPDIISVNKETKTINALKTGNVAITFTAKADYKYPNSLTLNIEVV